MVACGKRRLASPRPTVAHPPPTRRPSGHGPPLSVPSRPRGSTFGHQLGVQTTAATVFERDCLPVEPDEGSVPIHLLDDPGQLRMAGAAHESGQA